VKHLALAAPIAVLLLVWPAVSAGSAAQASPAAALPESKLVTWSQSPRLGVNAETEVRLAAPATGAEVGKVTLYVPAGNRLDLTAPPGTIEGRVLLATGSDAAVGDLEAVDPAAYADVPQSQACAPGPHAAVWTMPLDFVISSMRAVVPIYLDPTTGAEEALGAYKLQICLPLTLIPSPGGWPVGSRLSELALDFARITNPAAPGVYVWRAFVTNPDESGNPDSSTTYELRSDVPLPANLTLTGRFDRKDDRALLNGRYAAETVPTGGIPIALYRVIQGGTRRHVATTRTSANGSYHFVRQLAKTSTYRTEVSWVGGCAGDSAAPRGCVDETRGAIDSSDTRIVVPHRNRSTRY
jgi:hypothetical protein